MNRIGSSRNELLDEITVLYGAIEAERLLIGDVSTGASGWGDPKSDLPNFVSVGLTLSAGFLGIRYAPFEITKPGELPENVASPTPDARLARRLAALDEQTRLLLGDKITQIQQDLNQTTLLITHNLTEAVQLSDRIVVINYGQKIAEGTPHEIGGPRGCDIRPSDERRNPPRRRSRWRIASLSTSTLPGRIRWCSGGRCSSRANGWAVCWRGRLPRTPMSSCPCRIRGIAPRWATRWRAASPSRWPSCGITTSAAVFSSLRN